MEERFNSVVAKSDNVSPQVAIPQASESALKTAETVADSPVFDKFAARMEEACFSKAVIKTYQNILKKEYAGKEPTIEELGASFSRKYLKTIESKFKGSFLSQTVVVEKDEQQSEADDTGEPAMSAVTAKKPRVAVFVGPTGVGKTTTVVKYACSLLHEGKSVVLIAADTFKMGAIEQLQFFAEKMNMGFDVVYEMEKLSEHIARHQDADYILIDTVGRSPLSKGQLSRMQNSLPEELGAEVHLVISAVAKYQDMEKIIYGYRGFCADYLLFTKLDETCVYGPVLSILQKWQRKVSFMTNGQTVPGDICLCSENAVNKLLFNDGNTLVC
jgi:flagellar biosynthesis GTPase FlhF